MPLWRLVWGVQVPLAAYLVSRALFLGREWGATPWVDLQWGLCTHIRGFGRLNTAGIMAVTGTTATLLYERDISNGIMVNNETS